MPELLFDDPLLRITADREARMVRYERTELPFASMDELSRVHDALVRAVLGLPRTYSVLLDLRRAPPRNDEEYESAIEKYVETLLRHFRAYAILVKTAAGKLQVIRLEKRKRRSADSVFVDEDQALAYLTGG